MASSMEIWKEARRRAMNHLRMALIERGMNSAVVAKMKLDGKVDELLGGDSGEYIRVAFVKLNVEIGDEHND